MARLVSESYALLSIGRNCRRLAFAPSDVSRSAPSPSNASEPESTSHGKPCATPIDHRGMLPWPSQLFQLFASVLSQTPEGTPPSVRSRSLRCWYHSRAAQACTCTPSLCVWQSSSAPSPPRPSCQSQRPCSQDGGIPRRSRTLRHCRLALSNMHAPVVPHRDPLLAQQLFTGPRRLPLQHTIHPAVTHPEAFLARRRSSPRKWYMSPVSLTILFKAPTACFFPARTNAESSTYHDLETGVGLPSPVGTCAGCVRAACATCHRNHHVRHWHPVERHLGRTLACPVLLSMGAFPAHRKKNAEGNSSCSHRRLHRVQIDVVEEVTVEFRHPEAEQCKPNRSVSGRVEIPAKLISPNIVLY